MLFNSEWKYGFISRTLHWFTALAIIAALVFIEVRGILPTPLRRSAGFAHIQAGLIVLLLTIPRLVWRSINTTPNIVPPPSQLSRRLSEIGHWCLYALMILLPILGIAFIQGGGREVSFFGLFTLPRLFPQTALAGSLKDLHMWLGNVLLWFAILHVFASFWHHMILKDNTLSRMLGRQP
ncbi:cytochrome b [Neisseriaceae bacterium TC5R-5]|nr:cytochrome b [Neisseriaceae bacterium TC5R-5]